MRIFFKEQEKLENQLKFKKSHKEYVNKTKSLQTHLKSNQELINVYQNKIEALSIDFTVQQETLEFKIEEIISEDIIKKTNSLIYKILSFLRFINIQHDIDEVKKTLESTNTQYQQEIEKLNHILNIKKDEVIEIQNEIEKIEKIAINLLQPFQDGEIIGDGRADFTQKTTVYNFEYLEQKFSFLDIPGIEGKESVVIDEISLAVKKAHAVFYVISSSTPPQKGDKNKKGTLEKIKEHLGSQTEVYTIFNKRVTNPMQLNKSLISEGEKDSLNVVDEKISEVLGINYVQSKCVSAKVSFLALANCLLTDSTHYNEQKKFLDKFKRNELLEKSLFTKFCYFIATDIVQNTKQKIKKSNFNKANNLLKELITILHQILKENFEPLYKQLVEEVDDASNNLRNTLRKTKVDLDSVLKKELRNFENATRREIYDYIDSNVSDDYFKSELEDIIQKHFEKMIENIPISIEKEVSKFYQSTHDVLETFERRVSSAIEEFQTFSFDTNGVNFNIDIQIDNGIDSWGLAGSFLGAGATAYWAFTAGNIWNPAGWTMATLGIVVSALTVIVTFGKSIYKFFSDDYKKAEQRRTANENIDRIVKNINQKLSKNLEPTSDKFKELINNIITDLERGVEQQKKVNEYIKKSHAHLIQISKQIQLEGEK